MTQNPSILNPLDFPLNGQRLIEASAGTGKTWTIAALYLRLVLGHGDGGAAFARPLLPPEILVVTFTEAATQELRERIRARLIEAARCFRGQEAADPWLASLIERCGEQRRLVCARMLQIAADWMDEAAIYTIHGWCNRMLRQHAFDSGSLFDLELDAGDQELLVEVARDYWRMFFYPLPAEVVPAIRQLAVTPDALLAGLKALLSEDEGLWLGGDQQPLAVDDPPPPQQVLQTWLEWQRRRAELDQQARQIWARDRVELETWLRSASEQRWLSGTSYPAKTFESRLQALAAWADRGESCDAKWLVGFAQSRFKLNKGHQDKLPVLPAFVALDALAEHLQTQPEVNLPLKLHARCWIRRRYQEQKQSRARLDYDDLLTHLDRALRPVGGERLARVIRAQFPVAMIDEFQDTDPLQYRIFGNVYRRADAEEAVALLLIGDPKQAIYAFRGADIHTYLQAKRDVAGGLFTLNRNFRSTRALVSAVNRVFEYAESHVGGAFKFKAETDVDNPLPFQPVEAQGRPEQLEIDGEAAAAMTIWHHQHGAGACINAAAYQQQFAAATASHIAELLTLAKSARAGFRGDNSWQTLKPADIAILVRNRREAAAIRAELIARGLRSVYLSDRDSVFHSREASDLLRWLRACAEPEQGALLRAALATETLNLSLSELDEFNADELRWERQVEHAKALQGIWRNQGVLPMLRRLMSDFGLPGRMLAEPGGERALTNLLHLSELLQRASVELDGEQALIRYLADHIESANGADDESLLRLESDAGLIKVVTLHKSKGLEYPLVYLPFICTFREVAGNRSSYYRFHDDQGRLCIDLGKSDAGRLRAERERLQEDLRLLYVGLTRARHACWLGVAPLKVGNSDQCQLHKSALGYVLAGDAALPAELLAEKLTALRGGCVHIAVEPPPAITSGVVEDEAVGDLSEARQVGARRAEKWWIASYSGLVQGAETEAVSDIEAPESARQANLVDLSLDQDAAVVRGATANIRHQFPRGSQAGVFLHAALEWAAQTGFAQAAADAGLRERFIAPRCERRGWSHWIPGLNLWLGELLTLELPIASAEQSAGHTAAPTADSGRVQTDLFEMNLNAGRPFSLAALNAGGYLAELEFWFAAEHVEIRELDALLCRHTLDGAPRPALKTRQLQGMVKGFIDLVFEFGGRYYIADYKSNWLGGCDADYTAQAMRDAVLAERYDLQYGLYLLALHRLLKSRLGDAYDYDSDIGGAVYLFLRGVDGPAAGVHCEKPPKVLIEALDSLFAGREWADVA